MESVTPNDTLSLTEGRTAQHNSNTPPACGPETHPPVKDDALQNKAPPAQLADISPIASPATAETQAPMPAANTIGEFTDNAGEDPDKVFDEMAASTLEKTAIGQYTNGKKQIVRPDLKRFLRGIASFTAGLKHATAERIWKLAEPVIRPLMAEDPQLAAQAMAQLEEFFTNELDKLANPRFTGMIRIHSMEPSDIVEAMREYEDISIKSWNGSIYFFNGIHYEEIPSDVMDGIIRDFIQKCCVIGLDGRPTRILVRKTLVKEVVAELKSGKALLPGDKHPSFWITETPESADFPPEETAQFRNCLVNMRTGKTTKNTSNYFSLGAADYNYNPDALEPLETLRFLHATFAHDPAIVNMLLEWIGLSLCGANPFDKILFLFGPRRSGKTTFNSILRQTVGTRLTAAPKSNGFGKDFGLAGLVGKKLAIMGDSRGCLSAAATESLLCLSGSDLVDVNRKHRDAITCRPTVKIVFSSNQLLEFKDPTGTFASRLLVAETRISHYEDEDVGLRERLTQEVVTGGMANVAIAAYRRLMARGRFAEPASSVALRERMADLAAPVEAFLNNCCKRNSGRTVGEVLHKAYEQHQKLLGEDACAYNQFGKELRRLGIIRSQPTIDGERKPCYNVTLLPPTPPETMQPVPAPTPAPPPVLPPVASVASPEVPSKKVYRAKHGRTRRFTDDAFSADGSGDISPPKPPASITHDAGKATADKPQVAPPLEIGAPAGSAPPAHIQLPDDDIDLEAMAAGVVWPPGTGTPTGLASSAHIQLPDDDDIDLEAMAAGMSKEEWAVHKKDHPQDAQQFVDSLRPRLSPIS